jgi:hypothetical protein
MLAKRVPTATVESTATSIESKTPAAGDGISVSTLSVETSNNGSSTATFSPTFFNQRVTVPSVTDSPSAGMTTGVAAPFAAGVGEGEGARVGVGAGEGVGAATVGAGVETGAAAGAAGADVAVAPSAMIANSAPTGATLSTGTTIFCRMPAAGDGISVSTLSVETSSSGSSRATWSPSDLSQRVTVPSVTLSPRAGIFTEKLILLTPIFAVNRGTELTSSNYKIYPWACNGFPARAKCASPIASERVGCA